MKLWVPANGRRLAGRKRERNPLDVHGIPLQSQNNTSVVKQARASQVTQPRRCVSVSVGQAAWQPRCICSLSVTKSVH